MFRSLLAAGNNFLTVHHDVNNDRLVVSMDRQKIKTVGRPAIAKLLLHLHIYRCTADVEACRVFYEDLTRVEGTFCQWRSIVIASQEPRQIFVQPNTFLIDGKVVLKEYEPTVEGMLQSWAARDV